MHEQNSLLALQQSHARQEWDATRTRFLSFINLLQDVEQLAMG